MPSSDAAQVPAESDADLAAALLGDIDAFARVLLRHERAITRHLRRFTNNESELPDLRQETYLEACKSLSTFRSQGSFFAWLRCIASRVGYRFWTRRARARNAAVAYVELQADNATTLPALDDTVERVQCLLRRLDYWDRRIVEMKYLDGLKSTEIARRTGWGETRVRVRLHRALRKMRRGIEARR